MIHPTSYQRKSHQGFSSTPSFFALISLVDLACQPARVLTTASSALILCKTLLVTLYLPRSFLLPAHPADSAPPPLFQPVQQQKNTWLKAMATTPLKPILLLFFLPYFLAEYFPLLPSVLDFLEVLWVRCVQLYNHAPVTAPAHPNKQQP